MRRHDDPQITCPIDASHKMPSLRLPWHLPKCKKTFFEKNPGAQLFFCRFHYLHIFKAQDQCALHEQNECDKNLDVLKLKGLQQIQREKEEQGSDSSSSDDDYGAKFIMKAVGLTKRDLWASD